MRNDLYVHEVTCKRKMDQTYTVGIMMFAQNRFC